MSDTATTVEIPKQVTIDGLDLYRVLVGINTVRLVHFHDGNDKAEELLDRAVRELSEPLGGGRVGSSDIDAGHLTPLSKQLSRDSALAALEWFESLADCFREEAEGNEGPA